MPEHETVITAMGHRKDTEPVSAIPGRFNRGDLSDIRATTSVVAFVAEADDP